MAYRWWAVDGQTLCASWDGDLMTIGWNKGDYISSVYMVREFTVNLYIHCCYRCCYMYIVDCNKDLIFFSAFLDLQSIRDGEATTQRSSFSLMLWQMLWLLHRKHEFEVQTLAKQLRSMKVSENIRKLPFSIIRTTDYPKGFLRSLALRIIEVWLYMQDNKYKQWFVLLYCTSHL